jgi:small conductance mechanosensitive channel
MEEELQQLSELGDKLKLFLIERGVSIAVAMLIIALGFWISRVVGDFILRFCAKKNLDPTLGRFFSGFSRAMIVIFALVLALSKVGIEITPFVALIGAGAFGLSLAVQGPVSNYGAGVVLIITRPFKVGDTLTLNELTGLVDSINLGNTRLVNEDDETITIPNRKILGEILINSYAHRIVEGIVGIDYGADPEVAIAKIQEALQAVEGIAPDRKPDVGIDRFGDSSIDIGYRVWVITRRYHRIRYTLNLAVFKALREAGITIPFPQRDVHLIKGD